MRRYEYAYKSVGHYTDLTTKRLENLNQLGQEGWLLTGKLSDAVGRIQGLFVRELED